MVILGVALLVLLAMDVFSTVFSPWGRGGIVNRQQNRLIWALFRAGGIRRDGSARDHLLSLGGPVLVVLTLALWMVWLVVAFAMIYQPFTESFLFSPGGHRGRWLEAIYFSGYTAATLGFGDMIPNTAAFRLLAPLEAFGGFALVSISVTYFLAVYRELVVKQSVATTIQTYFAVVERGDPSGNEGESLEPFARWCEAISRTLSSVMLSHYQYPVLHYFRPANANQALIVQLEALVDLRRRVRHARSAVLQALGRHPSYLALERTVETVVTEFGKLSVPESIQPPSAAGDEAQVAYERLRSYLLYR